jgi:hypothetical protein
MSDIRGSARVGTLRDIASGGGPAPGPPRGHAGDGHGHDGDDGENGGGDEGESWFAGGERR